MTERKPTVLITGAGVDGIGGALVEQFILRGFHVFASARRLETVEPLLEFRKLPGGHTCTIDIIPLDVTNLESIQKAKEIISATTGGTLDILINNAGIGHIFPAIDLPIEESRKIFETNVLGVMAVTQVFAPLLIKSRGKIVQIGSVAAIIPYSFNASYNASKAALHSYSNSLRQELAPFGVRVIVVVTGGVKSQIARYANDTKLASNSLYLPIDSYFQKRLHHSQESAVPADVYAKSVVVEILKENPSPWLYKGYFASLTWIIDTFMPKSFWDYFVPKMFGLTELKKIWDGRINGGDGLKLQVDR